MEYSVQWVRSAQPVRYLCTARSTLGTQVARVVKNPSANTGDIKRCVFDPWVGKIPWRRKWQPTPSCLGNPMDWWAIVNGLQRVGHDLATKQ